MESIEDLIGNVDSNSMGSVANCSDAMFALRFVLHHKEFCTNYMDDCEPLLLLIGKSVVWPYQIAQSVVAVAPQAFHFAFRQPGWFADRWLDYGFVVRTGREVRLLHINGKSESYKTRSLEEPTYVETFFGPSTVEFCIASLHPFTHCVDPVETCSDSRVRFQA